MPKAAFVLLTVAGLALPGVADARTCLDAYYECLNNTYKSSGLARWLYDNACAMAYGGCLRNSVK